MSRGRPAPLMKFQHIIQLFTVLLTAILISLFFAALVLVGKIQGCLLYTSDAADEL